ncbi:Uncharacterised protein [uncultured archaeon]|nr:Uncharacterised protein [uncultured archaeon]
MIMPKDLDSLLSEMKSIHSDLIPISPEIIVVAEWVRLKCRYGCNSYGTRLCCPPYTPTPQETRAILSEFRHAVLARFEIKSEQKMQPKNPSKALGNSVIKIHKTIAELEKTAFLAGYYKAFAMSGMPCSLCETCVIEEMHRKDQAIFDLDSAKCRHKEIMRPSMEACGIDVFKTLQNAGYKSHVLGDCSERVEVSGLVLLD